MIQHNWSAVLIVYEFVSFAQFNVPFAFVNTLKCTQGTIHIHTLEAHVAIIILCTYTCMMYVAGFKRMLGWTCTPRFSHH